MGDQSNTIGSALHNVTTPFTQGFTHMIAQHWNDFINMLQDQMHKVMEELINWILNTPYIGHDPITMKVWWIIRVISFSLITLIMVYEGFKKTAAMEQGIGNAMDMKQLIVKCIYGVMLAIFSLDIVNIFIGLNNAFVHTIAANFPMHAIADSVPKGIESSLLMVALAIAQIVIAVRLIIHYWIRQAKIILLAVLAPLVYILGIRQATNRVSTWMTDLATTIFSQTLHALMLAMYAMLLSLTASAGTFSSAVLSVAMLLLMLEAPPMLRQYIGGNSSGGINNPIASVRRWTTRPTKQVMKKVGGWFKSE